VMKDERFHGLRDAAIGVASPVATIRGPGGADDCCTTTTS
jgi:hypothetical protein